MIALKEPVVLIDEIGDRMKIGRIYPSYAKVEGIPLFVVKIEKFDRKSPFHVSGKVFYPHKKYFSKNPPYPLTIADIDPEPVPICGIAHFKSMAEENKGNSRESISGFFS